MISNGDRGPLGDLFARDHGNRCRRIKRLFRTATACGDNGLIQLRRLFHQRCGDRRTGTERGEHSLLVAERTHGHRVRTIGQIDDTERTVSARDRAIRKPACGLRLDLRIFKSPAACGVSDFACDGASLRRQQCGRERHRYRRANCV